MEPRKISGLKIPENVGEKVQNLCRAQKAGFKIPPGWVLPSSCLKYFLLYNHITPSDEKFENSLMKGEFPPRLQSGLLRVWKMIKRRGLPLICRSSASCEDKLIYSFPGIFETRANIFSFPQLKRAVKEVWASLYGEKARLYLSRIARLPVNFSEITMSVIIQKQISPVLSGICHTGVAGRSSLYLEAVFGYNDLLTQGLAVPERIILEEDSRGVMKVKRITPWQQGMVKLSLGEIHKNNSGLLQEIFGEKIQLNILGRRFAFKLMGVNLDEHTVYGRLEVENGSCLDDKLLQKLGKKFLQLASSFKTEINIEWAIDNQGELYILQVKPVARTPFLPGSFKNFSGKESLKGDVISCGRASGEARVVKGAEKRIGSEKGIILVADYLLPKDIPLLLRAKAVVVEEVGLLSHTANICREMGIPALANVYRATCRIKDGAKVVVDCTGKGEVIILSTENCAREGSEQYNNMLFSP